jgi:dTDP-4-dehydrorhamnose 3,5-epimerase
MIFYRYILKMTLTKPLDIIGLPIASDSRGTFLKIFQSKHPILQHFAVKQINLVKSSLHTLRGLHYQTGYYAESKFFRIIDGSIQLVCICIDPQHSQYLKSHSYLLTDKTNGVLVPKGYATGYLCLSEGTEVLYLSDNDYFPEAEKGLRWNDPVISIAWQNSQPLLSEKDQNWPDFVTY